MDGRHLANDLPMLLAVLGELDLIEHDAPELKVLERRGARVRVLLAHAQPEVGAPLAVALVRTVDVRQLLLEHLVGHEHHVGSAELAGELDVGRDLSGEEGVVVGQHGRRRSVVGRRGRRRPCRRRLLHPLETDRDSLEPLQQAGELGVAHALRRGGGGVRLGGKSGGFRGLAGIGAEKESAPRGAFGGRGLMQEIGAPVKGGESRADSASASGVGPCEPTGGR